MKIASIILARGGSKGVPRKNIKELAGRPLIDYTIQASKASDVHETWVSTEDAEIKSVAESCGAFVIDRPAEMAQDASPNELAVLHWCEHVECDVQVQIQPIAPLLQATDINRGLAMIEDGYNSVICVYRQPGNHLEWTLDEPHVPLHQTFPRPDGSYSLRRQDMKDCFVNNGAFYIQKRALYVELGRHHIEPLGLCEMPFSRSFEIDTPDDFKLVEQLIRGAESC